jgi:D-xylose transport system permease protein
MSRTEPMQPELLDQRDERVQRLGNDASLWQRGLDQVRNGDIGVWPIVMGLIVICLVFQMLNPVFLSSRNLSNLLIEAAPVGILAVGVVLVLLVAQIDLSVGSMSGVASAILGVSLTQLGWSLPAAVLVALSCGVFVGLLYGVVYLKFGVPSFVVTLAGLMALLGLQLQILGTTGSINISFETWIVRFMQQMYLAPATSYVLGLAGVLAYAASRIRRASRRRAVGLSARSNLSILANSGALAAVVLGSFWYLNTARGVGLPFVLLVALVLAIDWALQRTRWGRSVYAIGGSVEAARRAGINVGRTYLTVFVLCSTLAALGGLLAAGRLATASVSSGGGETNLNAIAAAVIGGTSLFGGRGYARSALLGILIIATISNGLTLLNLGSSVRFMITGGVLMIAVIIDSVARRSRAAHGRA